MPGRYNEILVGRFNRALQKLFGLKGSPPVPSLASEISPTHPLYNGVENRYLEGWERFGTVMQIGAAAGFPSAVRLRNPSTSNVIAVIEHLGLLVNPTAIINFDLAAVSLDLAVAQVSQRLDARTRTRSSLILSGSDTVGGFATSIWQEGIVAGSLTTHALVTENHELPVLPGDALTMATNINNVAFNASVLWRERPLEDQEKF